MGDKDISMYLFLFCFTYKHLSNPPYFRRFPSNRMKYMNTRCRQIVFMLPHGYT